MEAGKVLGPSGIITEMIRISGGVEYVLPTSIVNQVIHEGITPNGWCSIIVNCYKSKANTLNRNNCRGIKLSDQLMKVRIMTQ